MLAVSRIGRGGRPTLASANLVRTSGTREILVGALYGIIGGAVPAELRALSDRLAHRGREAAEWSPGRDLHLGIRGPRRIVDVQEHGAVAFEGAIDNRDEIVRLLRRRAGDGRIAARRGAESGRGR